MWNLVTFLLVLRGIKADVGGHDLFTSLAQLEVLWHNEMEMIQVMENAIIKMEQASKAMKA